MKTRRSLPFFALLAFSLTASAASAARPPVPTTWTVGGVAREALVFAPSVAGARVPLVFAFHGHGGNMYSSASAFRIHRIWPEALVVYMQGLPTASSVDPLGRRPGWQHEIGELGDRDLKFFDAVLASLRAKYPVDGHRIYATGFSNGGFFTYLLWAARGGTFAAFAPCAGRIALGLRLAEPKPVLQIAGKADELVTLASVEATLATVRALDGATGSGAACGPDCTLYPSTRNAPVEVILHAGGHIFPPWAPAKIVEFFQAH